MKHTTKEQQLEIESRCILERDSDATCEFVDKLHGKIKKIADAIADFDSGKLSGFKTTLKIKEVMRG